MAVLKKWRLAFRDGASGPPVTGMVWCATMNDINPLVEAQFPNQTQMTGWIEPSEEHAPAFVAD